MQQPDPSVAHTLAELSAYPIDTPTDGLTAELTGAINRLHQQDIQNELKQLIEKSKIVTLSDDEKRTLKQLLSNKNKKLLDC